jgi:hypothetical protein
MTETLVVDILFQSFLKVSLSRLADRGCPGLAAMVVLSLLSCSGLSVLSFLS